MQMYILYTCTKRCMDWIIHDCLIFLQRITSNKWICASGIWNLVRSFEAISKIESLKICMSFLVFIGERASAVLSFMIIKQNLSLSRSFPLQGFSREFMLELWDLLKQYRLTWSIQGPPHHMLGFWQGSEDSALGMFFHTWIWNTQHCYSTADQIGQIHCLLGFFSLPPGKIAAEGQISEKGKVLWEALGKRW